MRRGKEAEGLADKEETLENMSANEIRKLLTDRQIAFVEALLLGLDSTAAAIEAGYSERSAASQASRMLKNDKIAAYRRARYIDLYDKAGISPEWVGLKLVEIVDRCMEAKPHLSWDESAHAYVPDGSWCFDAKGATTALTAIGKSMGMFSDKAKPKGDEGARKSAQSEGMSLEEKLSAIAQAAQSYAESANDEGSGDR